MLTAFRWLSQSGVALALPVPCRRKSENGRTSRIADVAPTLASRWIHALQRDDISDGQSWLSFHIRVGICIDVDGSQLDFGKGRAAAAVDSTATLQIRKSECRSAVYCADQREQSSVIGDRQKLTIAVCPAPRSKILRHDPDFTEVR